MINVPSNVLSRTFDLSTAAKPYKPSMDKAQPNVLDGSGSGVTLQISKNARMNAPTAMSLQDVAAFDFGADAAPKSVVVVDTLENIQAALDDGSLLDLANSGRLFNVRATSSPNDDDQAALNLTAEQMGDSDLYSKIAGAKLKLLPDDDGAGRLTVDVRSASMLLDKIQKGTLTGVTSLDIRDTGANIQKNMKMLSTLHAMSDGSNLLGNVEVTDAKTVRTNFKVSVDQALNFGRKLIETAIYEAPRGEELPSSIPPKPVSLTVVDRARNIENKQAELNELDIVDSMRVVDGALHLDAANDDLLTAAKKGGLNGLEVRGGAGDIERNLDTLEALAAKRVLKRLGVEGTDNKINVDIATLRKDSNVAKLAVKGGADFLVEDTAANIGRGLDELQSMMSKRILSKTSEITTNDVVVVDEEPVAVAVAVTASQLRRNAGVISILNQSISLSLEQTESGRVQRAAMAYDANSKIETSMVSELKGTSGSDVIAAGLSRNVTIDGGKGQDIAKLAGQLDDYEVKFFDKENEKVDDDRATTLRNLLAAGLMDKDTTYSFYNAVSDTTVTAKSFESLDFYDPTNLPWDASGRQVNIKA
jgi:hypothetical protein